MQIFIGDAAHQTFFFGIAFAILLFITYVIKKDYTPLSLTQELKGLAILTILFGHIGYFLSANQEFLYPFSIASGVGVNLFLFLSGYGLTVSQLKKGESPIIFYKRRLSKLFIPFWIVMGIFVLLDFIVLGKTYSTEFLSLAIFGIFTHADLFADLNSPFWYLTFILLYYLLFPLFFNKKRTWITAILLYMAVRTLVEIEPEPLKSIIGMYEVHMLAFPFGVFVAWFIQTRTRAVDYVVGNCTKYAYFMYPLGISFLTAWIAYFSLHSDVGQIAAIEQRTSLMVVSAILLLFIIKRGESKLLSVFGLFSYEIYLLHWPLLYRYDILYKFIPGWIATIVYLGLFILLGMLLQKIPSFVSKKIASSKFSIFQ